MNTPIISVNAVKKSVMSQQETLLILNEVTFDVNSGETVAIVGTSGAGKSTLMTLLAGLSVPSSGNISLFGQNISQLDDEARASIRRDNIGFVFQSFLLVPTLTALENVTLPCLINGKEEDVARATELLTSLGLGHRLNHTPGQLSGGEQQRVAIARAFMTSPKILFADEPTGNLDQETAKVIIEQLFSLNKDHGTTLVLVTHDENLAKRCKRTLRISAGQLVEDINNA
jgi:putative ABC transport system ATP-binding protein